SSFTGHSRFSFLLSIILLALNFTVQLSVDYSRTSGKARETITLIDQAYTCIAKFPLDYSFHF
ncbi:hypothetical protein ACQKMD_21725, partial [Viridibacillus sp. NPDC096237]|uniref:hypothetical protein n=1 Tax=Viridibacillus sp. NPDC096237 TaxID=3390721 RepID=UPI003D0371CB